MMKIMILLMRRIEMTKNFGFDNWKKRAKSKYLTWLVNNSDVMKMCEAAYKAGERSAKKQQNRRLRNEH